MWLYLAILVVEENDKTKGPSSHRLSWDKGVLKGGLLLGLHHSAERQGCELQNKANNKEASLVFPVKNKSKKHY